MPIEIKRFLESNGIFHDKTISHDPWQNGVAERMNWTLGDLTRSMLHFKSLDKKFWAEAISVGCYIRNRASCRSLSSNPTPFEVLIGRKSNVSNLWVFRCKCYYTLPKNSLGKLDDRVREPIFIGCVPKGYKLCDTQEDKPIVSRDVKFLENSSSKSCKQNSPDKRSTKSDENHIIDEFERKSFGQEDEIRTKDVWEDAEDTTVCTTTEDRIENRIIDDGGSAERYNVSSIRRSSRPSKVPGEWWKAPKALTSSVYSDPMTYREAILCSKSEQLEITMQQAYSSLMENKTWKLVPRLKDHNVVSCKWVYLTKEEVSEDGKLHERFKERLVARGFSQIEGIDYFETYAPVVKLPSVRTILAIVAIQDMELHQMDVVTAF